MQLTSEQPPECRGCGEFIQTRPLVQALNSDWHPQCFRCSSCGQRLSNWYVQNGASLYCRRDYWARFGDRCHGCGHVVAGPVMVAAEHKYHCECFQCCQCQSLIGEGEAYALVERTFLYCGSCYRIGPASQCSPQTGITESQTHVASTRRKPHSIQMVEIPPTPEYQAPSCQEPSQHQDSDSTSPKLRGGRIPVRNLKLSLQVASADSSLPGWRSSSSYRHSFTLEAGRLTPCIQISELDSSPELNHLVIGDRILEVNGTAVRDQSLEEIKTLLTNYKDKVHVMVERDLSPLRLPPDEDFLGSSSPVRSLQPSRNASSDDLNSTSASEGEIVTVLNQSVKLRPKGSLRAKGHSPSRRRSKSPSPCPSSRQKSIDLSRSHSFSTRQDHRAFRPTDLIVGEILGQGFFGQAVKATHRTTGEQMVLKELHNFDEDAQKSFLREVSMLRSLSHPCVLKFLGVLYREKKLNLVTEFIDGGTLSDLLLDHSVELSWKQRVAFAKDISAGMSYLHSMNVIHRDLNSQNCLVRKDQSVVVADFGLAKIFRRHELPQFPTQSEKEAAAGGVSTGGKKKKRFSRRKRGTVVGNPYWMAPEMMTKGVYDEKVDVFSYGIIVCETIARVTADPDYLPRSFDFGLNVDAFHARFCKGDVPEPYFMLGVLCAQLEPDQRPSFDRINVLCEALHLHVEHGMAVPPELQGSTVEFYHASKEKLYGHNYKNDDSCTQANTSQNTVIITQNSSLSETETEQAALAGTECEPSSPNSHVSQEANGEESSDSRDMTSSGEHDEVLPELASCCPVLEVFTNGGEVTSSSTPDGTISKPTASSLADEVCVGTDSNTLQDGDQTLDCSQDILPSRNISSPVSCIIEQLDLPEDGMSLDRLGCCDGLVDNSGTNLTLVDTNGDYLAAFQNLHINTDDGVNDSSLATTMNEDYAYFSCSSESLSVSMSSPCLSVEDFTSCRSSPNYSGCHKIISNEQKDVTAYDIPSVEKDISKTNHSSDPATLSGNQTHNFPEANTNMSINKSQDTELTGAEVTADVLSSLTVLESSLLYMDSLDDASLIDTNKTTPLLVADSTQGNHSKENVPKSCSPSRDYQASVQLEYGLFLKSPPVFTSPPINSNDCDL